MTILLTLTLISGVLTAIAYHCGMVVINYWIIHCFYFIMNEKNTLDLNKIQANYYQRLRHQEFPLNFSWLLLTNNSLDSVKKSRYKKNIIYETILFSKKRFFRGKNGRSDCFFLSVKLLLFKPIHFFIEYSERGESL